MPRYRRTHPKLKDDDPKRPGYLLSQKAINYVRKLQLQHVFNQQLKNEKVSPLHNVLIIPGPNHPNLTWPVYFGANGEPIAIYTKGKLGQGAFGGVFTGVNLDTGKPLAIKVQSPKNEKEAKNIALEEETLQHLKRFDDSIKIIDGTQIQAFHSLRDLKMGFLNEQLEGLQFDVALVNLGIMSADEFADLMMDDKKNVEQIIDIILIAINKKYKNKFSAFLTDFAKNKAGLQFISDFTPYTGKAFKSLDQATFTLILKDGTFTQFTPLLEMIKTDMAQFIKAVPQTLQISAQDLIYGVTLRSYAQQQHTEAEMLDVAIQLLEKTHALHQKTKDIPQGFVHRDLKTENVMWDEETQALQLVDMGYARALDDKGECVEAVLIGTPSAIAPELIESTFNDKPCHYGPITDMYAVGVILLELFSKAKADIAIPFKATSSFPEGAMEQFQEILNQKQSKPLQLPPVLAKIADDVLGNNNNPIYDIIKKTLLLDPAKRITFKEAIEALKQIRLKMPPVQKTTSKAIITEQPASFSTVRLNKEQIQIRSKLKDLESNLRELLVKLAKKEPKREGRKSILVSQETDKPSLKQETNHWLSDVQFLTMKPSISPEDLNIFIKHIDHFLEHHEPKNSKLYKLLKETKSTLKITPTQRTDLRKL